MIVVWMVAEAFNDSAGGGATVGSAKWQSTRALQGQ